MTQQFKERLADLEEAYALLIDINNEIDGLGNGVFDRYKYPVITAQHAPITWKYDLDPATNPYLMERFGINAAFNAGAIKFNGKYIMVVRVEGADRKSFFAVAESPNGIDHFEFWERPITMPETDEPDTNLYDMRLTAHEDGWIYGLFCTERRDPAAPAHDQSMAIAACGIARTKDLLTWERLADLKTQSPQQRNVVLHPEFVNGKYALYTRPQDGFISAGKGGGIGFGLCDSMKNAVVDEETIIDNKQYHTVYEAKNGQGPAPIKTQRGGLPLPLGERNTAAGWRNPQNFLMTERNARNNVTKNPAGYFLAPEGIERIGDVSNVAFCNGWIRDEDGKVFIYYASSDTRMHVATTTVDKLVDYVMNTPGDGLRSATSVNTINSIINKNKSLLQEQ
jgi:4-O-beta-D-mannosyl-D-glucose phosphorylase